GVLAMSEHPVTERKDEPAKLVDQLDHGQFFARQRACDEVGGVFGQRFTPRASGQEKIPRSARESFRFVNAACRVKRTAAQATPIVRCWLRKRLAKTARGHGQLARDPIIERLLPKRPDRRR